jgi:hypothetical protein
VFSSALATTKTTRHNGFAYVDRGASITDQTNHFLTTRHVKSSVGATCNGGSCRALGVNATKMSVPANFIGNAQTSVPSNGSFSGDYYFSGSLHLYQSNLNISGPTRIFVAGALAIDTNIQNSSPSNLLFYVNGNVTTANSAILNAYIYSKEFINLGSDTSFSGAYTSKSDAILGQYSSLSYRAATGSNFNGFCAVTPPAKIIAEYRFDQCAYGGVTDDVIDTANNYHATSFGGTSVTGDGQIQSALALIDHDHHI